jgi:hypothetical protein
VPVQPLPDNPDLERLRGIATTLRDLVRADVPEAIDLVREHHPRLGDLRPGPATSSFKLADAQLTVARMYGFPSWPRLRRHVELVTMLSRAPHRQPVGEALVDDAGRADELLRLACLNYGNDSPDRWRAAARLLVEHPALARWSVHTAAATGDVAAAAMLLDTDPSAAGRQGGPFGWEPLLYLTYSRLVVDDGDHDHVAVARLLLEHGADPDAGYLWEGLPSPFTALTGVFGRGEQGAPPHHDELVLARLLLEAGAEANDSQTIYDRGLGDVPRDDTTYLALLLDFGLGRGDGGPWRRRLGAAHQAPEDLTAEALQHAAEAGLPARVRLLLDRGVDPNRRGGHPAFGGRTPYQGAVVHGNLEIAGWLADAGALTGGVGPLDRFVGAALGAHREQVDALLAEDPTLLDRALDERPDLVAHAADLRRTDAVRLLVAAGFDVNALAGSTALHRAAWAGDVELARTLVELGADPTIADTEHGGTPLGWALHGGQAAMAAYLETITPA